MVKAQLSVSKENYVVIFTSTWGLKKRLKEIKFVVLLLFLQ